MYTPFSQRLFPFLITFLGLHPYSGCTLSLWYQRSLTHSPSYPPSLQFSHPRLKHPGTFGNMSKDENGTPTNPLCTLLKVVTSLSTKLS